MHTVIESEAAQSCPTLHDPMDYILPGSSVHEISQTRVLKWVAVPFSRQEHWSGLPLPSPMRESESEVTQSCVSLSYPMDCSPPGFSVHGIFQARVLEWGAIAFSTSSSLDTDKSDFLKGRKKQQRIFSPISKRELCLMGSS